MAPNCDETSFEPTDDEIFYTIEVSGETYNECLESVLVAKLLVDEVLIVGDASPFIESDPSTHEGTLQLWVGCNDLFSWACADYETVTIGELPDLYRCHKADKRFGVWKWCCRRRKQRPQHAVEDILREADAWEPWLEELPKTS